MAIWQYTCILIPLRNFENNYIQFLKQKDAEYLKETDCFWGNYYLNKEKVSKKIDLNISEYKSENGSYIYWKGNTEKLQDNDCSLSYKGDFITGILIRFDLREMENIKKFVNLLLEIANEKQLKFMNLKYQFFDAKKDLLIEDIMNSNGMKFLENPEEFLNSLS